MEAITGKIDFDPNDLKIVQDRFHKLILERARVIPEYMAMKDKELPILTNETGRSEVRHHWYPVPGMYGGFKYWLIEFNGKPILITESWCRVAEGSEQKHLIMENMCVPVDFDFRKNDNGRLYRAMGCFMGQCVGDALGQMVEFSTKGSILSEYPDGVRDMANGGAWNTLAGQPTDDTEMALMLARSLVKERKFDVDKVYEAYQFWLKSAPFDCGRATTMGLTGRPDHESQANGSMMRISPLGIFGSKFELDTVAEWAMQDSRLTHPNIVCQKAVAIYVTTIAEAIATGIKKDKLYENALERAKSELYYEKSVYETLQKAADSLPKDFMHQYGWVLIAFQNAFYQLLHSESM